MHRYVVKAYRFSSCRRTSVDDFSLTVPGFNLATCVRFPFKIEARVYPLELSKTSSEMHKIIVLMPFSLHIYLTKVHDIQINLDYQVHVNSAATKICFEFSRVSGNIAN